jgi:glucosylceramidase
MKNLLVALAFLPIGASAQKAIMFSTTHTDRWVQSTIKPQPSKTAAKVLRVYTDSLLQSVDGFGGTFSERAWDAMQVLSEQQRLALMREFFGADGISFCWGRTPVGGNDMSLSTYTYNDVANDWTQRNFSIARDRYILLPMIKMAQKVRPDLRIWASPWTPPYWMKLSEHYSMKSNGINHTELGHNRMDPNYNVYPNLTGFKMMEGHLKAYAIYLAKYIKAYQQEGVSIEILMPQNEVQWEPCWQCCTWRAEDYAIFIGHYLGPQFDKDSIKTAIWMGTYNHPDASYVTRFFQNQEAKKYVKGIGVQWTGMQALPKIKKAFPEMPVMQTEGICGDGENDWSALEKSWERVVHCFKNGARSYMQWNLVLDETKKSLFEWTQNSLVNINRKTGQITRNDEYYLMKHLSHFVQGGSHLLKTDDDSNVLAFKNSSGKIVLVAYNPENTAVEKTILVENQKITIRLREKSINTIVL